MLHSPNHESRDGGRGSGSAGHRGNYRGNHRGQLNSGPTDRAGSGDSRGRGGSYRGSHRGGSEYRGRGNGRGRGAGRGFHHGGSQAQKMRIDQMEEMVMGDPVNILMTLAGPHSGFQETLQITDTDSVEALLILVARACNATGKQSILSHILQQVNTSGFLMRQVIMYITNCMMRPSLINHEAVFAICKILSLTLELIPAASSDNVTPVLAQLKSLNGMIPKLEHHMNDLQEQQAAVVRQIQGGFLVKQVAGHEHDDDSEPPDNFRQIPIAPIARDLKDDLEPFLRKNKITGSYRDVDHYLDVQFRLLREDYMMPLRQGIRELKRAGDKPVDDRYIQDVRIYNNVQNRGSYFNERGTVYRLCFDTSKLRKVRWEVSRRLIFGSLVCLSADNFNTFVIGTVAERDPKLLSHGLIDVMINDVRHFDADFFTNYKMVECAAYFEAYRYNLEGLQDLNENKLPFKDYLLNTRSLQADPPHYMRGHYVKFDFGPILKVKSMREPKRRLLEARDWPKAAELGLDDSQYKALHLALTREFSIIQGPPGTGKTFIGLRIVQLLLHNFDVWGHGLRGEIRLQRVNCPILIVCYTNHALDQFLEGILQFQKNEVGEIIRVGGRCQSENAELQSCVLSKLKRNRDIVKVPHEVREAKSAILEQMKGQEKHLADIGQHLGRIRNNVIHERELFNMMNGYHQQCFARLMQSNNKNQQCLMHKWLLEPPQNSPKNRNISGQELWDKGMDSDDDDDDDFETNNTMEGTTAPDLDTGLYQEEIRSIERERIMDNSDDEKDQRVGEKSKKTLDEGFTMNSSPGKTKKKKGKKQKSSDGEWQTVRSQKKIHKIIRRELLKDELMSDEEEATIADIWLLPVAKRWSLYRLWRKRFSQDSLYRMSSGIEQFNQLARRLKETRDEEDYHVLMHAKVVAMTTTCAAKYRQILGRVEPRIVVVEEAAEVLEAHIITSLSESCQHLILIGDHQQLRPNPTVYKLAKKYNLDISLFERMLLNNMHCACLQIQHRMRPEIVKLIVPHVYKSLQNAESVHQYENVQGINGNLFFVQHQHAESETFDTRSRTNTHEADYLAALCRYLIMQGYDESQVTILTTYTGQMFELKKRIRQDAKISGVRVTPVDNYQGEENDIILLSLVRSNEEGKIGFLKTANRICVALSRAKKGFYVIGDMKLMGESSKVWSNILDELDSEKRLVEGLPLFCQNHPETGINAVNPADFSKAPNGGCTRPCESRLQCGHVCSQKCHPVDPEHKKYQCEKPCIKTPCPLKHRCPKKCYEDCGDCIVPVEKIVPICGHKAMIPCHIKPSDHTCTSPCEHVLACGHICPNICGVQCISHTECTHVVKDRSWPCGHVLDVECYRNPSNYPCPIMVERELDCGHFAKMECSDDPHDIRCKEIINMVLCERKCQNNVSCFMKNEIVERGCQVMLDKTCEKNAEHLYKAKCCEYETASCKRQCQIPQPCGHQCQGICGQCVDSGQHKSCPAPCQRFLPCQHQCFGRCGDSCPPCRERCLSSCPHMTCRNRCGDSCFQCRAPCLWNCQHQQCQKKCGEQCDRRPCNRKCELPLICGHRCPGYCGEPCPAICPRCHGDYYERMQRALGVRRKGDQYVLLLPCRHVIPSSHMDQLAQRFIQNYRQRTRELQLFICPMCKNMVHYSPRYQEAIFCSKRDLERMKKMSNSTLKMQETLSSSNIGNELFQKMMKSNDENNKRLKECIGCLGLLHEISTTISKIKHAKDKPSGVSIKRLEATHKSYEDKLKEMAEKDLTEPSLELTRLSLNIALMFLRCILCYMLTYVKSHFKQNILIQTIRELEIGAGKKSSSIRRLFRNSNTMIIGNLPIGLRNGIEDYVKEVTKYFNSPIDHLLEKKWFICEQEHAYPVPVTTDVTEAQVRCPQCTASAGPLADTADDPEDDLEDEPVPMARYVGLGARPQARYLGLGARPREPVAERLLKELAERRPLHGLEGLRARRERERLLLNARGIREPEQRREGPHDDLALAHLARQRRTKADRRELDDLEDELAGLSFDFEEYYRFDTMNISGSESDSD